MEAKIDILIYLMYEFLIGGIFAMVLLSIAWLIHLLLLRTRYKIIILRLFRALDYASNGRLRGGNPTEPFTTMSVKYRSLYVLINVLVPVNFIIVWASWYGPGYGYAISSTLLIFSIIFIQIPIIALQFSWKGRIGIGIFFLLISIAAFILPFGPILHAVPYPLYWNILEDEKCKKEL
jgi:hypothetical protein